MPKFRDNCPNNHQQDDINIDTAKSILPMNKIFISTKQQSQKNKHKFDKFYCADITNELSVISYFTKPDIKTYFYGYRHVY